MSKSANKPSQKPQIEQKIWVMKNSLTEQEMDEAGERWVNHQGPYMTLAETLAYAAKRDKQTKEATETVDIPLASKTVNVVEEITIGKNFGFTDLMHESDDKTVRDVYKSQSGNYNDGAVRPRGSDIPDEGTSDREHHYH